MYEPKYWSNKGKYQKLYKKLFKELVPFEGECKTERGEILRIVSKLYYDIYNNGACNFDVLKDMRMNLLLLVPKYAYKATNEFIKAPSKKKWEDENYQKFLDHYVNWAILYVQALGSLEGLEKELNDVSD